MNRKHLIVVGALIVVTVAGAETPRDSKVFKRVFGISRILPKELVEKTKTLAPGERLQRDTDNDGQADELWYMDTRKRHNVDPLLVRVIDEDGDLVETGRGDLDSDCYFWDHNADGYIDVVTDYQDDDGDGDVDQMGVFYDKRWPDKKDDLTVWWSVDIGDDNLLWYDVNGTYYQSLCQWRTHFSGDELFHQFRLTEDDSKWVNVWEDPFAFYDPDNDLCSELVVRICAVGHNVKSLRYSIDADDDAHGRATHDYDFSVTALPPEEGLSSDGWSTETLVIRGIETHPALPWSKTQRFSQHASWAKAMLTWDEINSNTDENVDRDPNERWEGILNHASKHGDFPQVGGPPCSALNNRVEVSHAPASPLRLYLDRADHRLHLLGAEYGYLDMDYNFDGAVDATYVWIDDDGDGVLNKRAADIDADGTIDFETSMAGNGQEYDLSFEAIASFYPELLRSLIDESQQFVDVAFDALATTPVSVRHVMEFFAGPLAEYHPEREIGLRIRNSKAGARLYVELVRDRLFVELKRKRSADAGWADVEAAYLRGLYGEAAKQLAELTGVAMPGEDLVRSLSLGGQNYTRRIPVTVINSGTAARDQWPVVIDVSELQQRAPDFNPESCAVVDGEFRLAWRTVPHQVDTMSLGDKAQLAFLANLPAGTEKRFFIYYEPEAARRVSYPQLTRAVLDTPAYVAWESDAGAFRFYTGQFDFFGKQQDRRLARPDRLLYPIIDVDYHAEQDWGIDALHVGKTSGLGGLTMYVGDEECLIQSPAGEGHVEFEHRILGAGPVRAGVEITARNVIPENPDDIVRIRCYIYAGHQESEICVQLPDPVDSARLAPGLLRLEEDQPFADRATGSIGTWGYQDDEIGEIGLGLIVPATQMEQVVDLEEERRVLCRVDDRRFRYWIIGTWRRGMQYPVAPTVDNWQRSLTELAEMLNRPPAIRIGNAERAGSLP